MNLSELYVFVNPQLKEIKGIFQEQPQDYIKICTFPGLEEDQKADLGWANLPEHGFVRGERLKEYSCSDDQMEKIKFDITRFVLYFTRGALPLKNWSHSANKLSSSRRPTSPTLRIRHPDEPTILIRIRIRPRRSGWHLPRLTRRRNRRRRPR